MSDKIGHFWLNDAYVYTIRTAARRLGLNEWVALAVPLAESGYDAWAVGDCQGTPTRYVYGHRYDLPYFPQHGAYCSSYGLYQVNMAGGVGAGNYPEWWRVLNIFDNVNLATYSLAAAVWTCGWPSGDPMESYCCVMRLAGFPGDVGCLDSRIQAHWRSFLDLCFNEDGSWATLPPYDPPSDKAQPKPWWLCQVEPRVPPDFMGWCPEVAKVSLWMAAAPPGSGTTSPPLGLSVWDANTPVTIRAFPATDYIFDHWSGDASGSDSILTIIMNMDKHVTANFRYVAPEPERFTLHMTVEPPRSGRTEPPEGDSVHDAGSMKLCSAFPYDPFEFDYWSGDAMGTAAIVTVLMDRNKSVVANFKPKEPIPDTPIPTTLEGIRDELRRIEQPWKERV